MSSEPLFLQHLSATNDANGNPRRVWVAYSNLGHIVDVVDEGYSGKGRKYTNSGLVELPGIEITPQEYRRWIGIGENITGRFAVVDAHGPIHRFHTRARALKFRREWYAPEGLSVIDTREESK